MAIRLRNWFFTITATQNKEGTRFRTNDQPPQATFEDQMDSLIMKGESGDRAKEDTGVFNENNTGHVIAATDVQAKANEAKPIDRTLCVQPSQLPTVEGENQTVTLTNDTDYTNDEIAEVFLNPDTSRNRWTVRWKASFITWIQNLFNLFRTDITLNANNITSNASNITNLQNTDTQVRVSVNDTTPSFLSTKITAGTNINVTEINDGGVEELEISASLVNTDETVKVSGNDTTPGYLNGKLTVDTSQLSLTENNDGANETLEMSTIVKTKIVEIGDWNMDTTEFTNVSHGITGGVSKIREVFVTIRNDADNLMLPLNTSYDVLGDTTSDSMGNSLWNSSVVALRRRTGGSFDSVDWNSTSFNRGWITIHYVD